MLLVAPARSTWDTVPFAAAPSAVIVTLAGWPTLTAGRSLSVTDASTSTSLLRSVMTVPLTTSPAWIVTDETMPSIGAVSVRRSSVVWAFVTAVSAWDTDALSAATAASLLTVVVPV